jgi:hypothetical protein
MSRARPRTGTTRAGARKKPRLIRDILREDNAQFDPYMDPGMFGIEAEAEAEVEEETAKPKKSNTGMIIAVGAAAALLLFMKK